MVKAVSFNNISKNKFGSRKTKSLDSSKFDKDKFEAEKLFNKTSSKERLNSSSIVHPANTGNDKYHASYKGEAPKSFDTKEEAVNYLKSRGETGLIDYENNNGTWVRGSIKEAEENTYLEKATREDDKKLSEKEIPSMSNPNYKPAQRKAVKDYEKEYGKKDKPHYISEPYGLSREMQEKDKYKKVERPDFHKYNTFKGSHSTEKLPNVSNERVNVDFLQGRSSKSHSLTTKDNKLYSYDTVIAEKTGHREISVTNKKYSSTTSKQVSQLKNVAKDLGYTINEKSEINDNKKYKAELKRTKKKKQDIKGEGYKEDKSKNYPHTKKEWKAFHKYNDAVDEEELEGGD